MVLKADDNDTCVLVRYLFRSTSDSSLFLDFFSLDLSPPLHLHLPLHLTLTLPLHPRPVSITLFIPSHGAQAPIPIYAQFTSAPLRRALSCLVCCMPIYRQRVVWAGCLSSVVDSGLVHPSSQVFFALEGVYVLYIQVGVQMTGYVFFLFFCRLALRN